MTRLRVSGLAIGFIVGTVLIVSPLLLINDHDPTYTCRASPIVDVFNPEPEMTAEFRREVAFDPGYACNRTARVQVGIAGGLVVLSAGVYTALRRHVRRSR